MTTKDNTPKDTRPSSRRQFLKQTAAGAAAYMVGSYAEHNPRSNNFSAGVQPFELPADMSRDMAERYRKAYADLEKATAEAGKELYDTTSQYGITDVPRLMRGVNVTVIPAHGRSPCAITFSLRSGGPAQPMPAAARLLEATMQIAQLNELSRRAAQPAAPIDYDGIATRLLNAYQQQSQQKLNHLDSLKALAIPMMARTVDAAAAFTKPEPTPGEMALLEQRFRNQMADNRGRQVAGHMREGHRRSIEMMFMEETPGQKDKMVLKSARLDIPDERVLQRLKDSAQLNDTEQKVVEAMLNQLKEIGQARNAESNLLDFTFSMRTLLGSRDIPMHVTVKNPTLARHQEEARQISQQQRAR